MRPKSRPAKTGPKGGRPAKLTPALLAQARALLEPPRSLSVAEAAAEVGVSPATLYARLGASSPPADATPSPAPLARPEAVQAPGRTPPQPPDLGAWSLALLSDLAPLLLAALRPYPDAARAVAATLRALPAITLVDPAPVASPAPKERLKQLREMLPSLVVLLPQLPLADLERVVRSLPLRGVLERMRVK